MRRFILLRLSLAFQAAQCRRNYFQPLRIDGLLATEADSVDTVTEPVQRFSLRGQHMIGLETGIKPPALDHFLAPPDTVENSTLLLC